MSSTILHIGHGAKACFGRNVLTLLFGKLAGMSGKKTKSASFHGYHMHRCDNPKLGEC